MNDTPATAAPPMPRANGYTNRDGKLPDRKPVALDVAGHIASQGFRELAISIAGAEHAGRLQGTHRDPFDRMLAAQALARDLNIVSVDTVFDQFGVRRVW